MPDSIKIRRALISVYDKTGIVEFARALHDEFGVELISTGGTAKTLKEAGLPVTLVEELTGSPEMLDGRVKTLHPRIHAAILADRDNPEHMRQLREQGIEPIDMVVVNLYPFEKTIAQPDCTFEQAIEMIDIGGPCLLRAAAKNHRHVAVIVESNFDGLLQIFRENQGTFPAEQRRSLAAWAFERTSVYDRIVRRFLEPPPGSMYALPEIVDWRLERLSGTKYGENPHQIAGRYVRVGWSNISALLQSYPDGIERAISFNNLVDANAALDLCAELTRASLEHRLSVCDVEHRLLVCASEPKDSAPAPKPSLPASAAPPIAAPSTPIQRPEAVPRFISDERATRRNLPHFERPGATYFVSFHILAGELTPAERDLVMACCLYPEGRTAAVHAVVVMPDHVHLLLTPLEAAPGQWHGLSKILQGLKGVAARQLNELRGLTGHVWQTESFDYILRNKQELKETIEYLYFNPETVGLCPPSAYPWSVFETDLAWDRENSSVGIGPGREFEVGLETGATIGGRAWHRLVIGEKEETEPHRRIVRAPILCAVCFIKHTNACGTAIHSDPAEAYRQAYLGDPNAAMGGILAVNFKVDANFAETVMDTYAQFGKPLKDAAVPYAPGGFFIEVWLAPEFDEKAVEIIRTRKEWGQRVRLLAVGDMSTPPDANEMDFKRIAGGMLLQTRDLVGLNEEQWKVVTKRPPNESEMNDLSLAWLICKHTKSNAITICKDAMLLGNGAGQMSRVMSCRIATWLAKENGHADQLAGAVAASDAFFPFRDGPDILMDAGVTALIQPGGSKRDADTIAACDARGVAMIFTGTRHFKH